MINSSMNWQSFVGKTWRYNICCTTVNTIVSSVPFFEQVLNMLTRRAMWLRRAMNAATWYVVFVVTVISTASRGEPYCFHQSRANLKSRWNLSSIHQRFKKPRGLTHGIYYQ